MCGICFLKRGVPISHHTFTFNFFSDYLSGDFIPHQQKQKIINVSLSQHIINNKLILPSINIQTIEQAIRPRGPDSFYSFKLSEKGIKYQETESIQDLKQGESFMAQSILSLRGQMNSTTTNINNKQGHLIYNGQIYNTSNNLSPLSQKQNDTEWLYRQLESIPSQQLQLNSVKELFKSIRGDFCAIYQRDNKVFVTKDYFGKKSLVVGFEENGLIISSVGMGTYDTKNEGETGEGQKQQEKEEKEWLSKYKSEWNNSKSKYFYEIPRNTVIQIQFLQKETIWKREYIYHDSLTLSFPKQLSNPMETVYQDILTILKQSVTELVSNIRQFSQYFTTSNHTEPVNNQTTLTNAHISVLFSGGLDSTLIARLLDIILPPSAEIDLINIVFSADAPDRKTSLKSYQQLCLLNKTRKYNLILRNQTLESIQTIEKQHIKLIYPKNTHMDFNISAVLTIASEGTGKLYPTEKEIKSKAKILLTGLGADELFSGYSRYRVAYLRGGVEEQQRQMVFDLDRLWIRNLGRDDRAISNQGKESRYPFLFAPLVDYLKQKVPLSLMADYTKPKGEGDKIILREVARRLGLQEASKYKKTAIQFGTRLAKQSNIKAFGSNRRAKGTYHYETKQ